jgi:hypothetical protein
MKASAGMIGVVGAFLMAATLAVMTEAAAQSSGASSRTAEACLAKCRDDLKRAGLWEKYPRGYCRNKCGAYRGAVNGK